jgi:SPP1 gp7 family putative phage head morphogenesis protein
VAAQRQVLVLDALGGALQLLSPEDQALYQQLFEEMLTLSNEAGGTLAEQLLAAYDDDAVGATAAIPVAAVANIAAESTKRLYRYSDDFQQRAIALIGQGLVQGFGARKIQRDLQQQLGLSKGKAETIARTEVMAALNQSAAARYQQAGVEFVQWNVSPSEGLCGYCAARNQRVYRAAQVVYPLHPRDRCFLTPWKPEWQAKGLTDDAFSAEFRRKGLEQLAANGIKPNYGVSSFEKAAGLTEPPSVTWAPKDLPLSPQPAPKPSRSQSRATPRTAPTRQRPAAPARRPPPRLTPQEISQRIRSAEDSIRRNDFETLIAYDSDGKELLRKKGDAASVPISPEEGRSMKGAIVTHNHPMAPEWWKKERTSGTSFSPADIQVAASYEWGEIRAVTGGYRHSLKPPPGGWNAQWAVQTKPIYDRIAKEVEKDIQAQMVINARRLKEKGMSRAEIEAESYRIYNRDLQHEINRRFAKETGATYKREPWRSSDG